MLPKSANAANNDSKLASRAGCYAIGLVRIEHHAKPQWRGGRDDVVTQHSHLVGGGGAPETQSPLPPCRATRGECLESIQRPLRRLFPEDRKPKRGLNSVCISL